MTGRVTEIDGHCANDPACLLTELCGHHLPNGCVRCLPDVGCRHRAASFPLCDVFGRPRSVVRTGVRPLDSDSGSCLLRDFVTGSLTFGGCFWLVPCPLLLEVPRPCGQVQQWRPPQVWQQRGQRLPPSPWACCRPVQPKWAGKRPPQQPAAVGRGPAPQHRAPLHLPCALALPAEQGEARMAPRWTAAPAQPRRAGAAVEAMVAVEESWAWHRVRVPLHLRPAHKASLGGTTCSTGSRTACPQMVWFLFGGRHQADLSRSL